MKKAVNSTADVVRRSIQKEFDRFASTRDVLITGESRERDKSRLKGICNRPEFGPFLLYTTFRFDNVRTRPGIRTMGQQINLHPNMLDNLTLASIFIRHAFELSMLQRLLPDQKEPSTKLVIAALACQCAAAYYTTLTLRERQKVHPSISEWIVDLADQGLGDPAILLEHLRQHAEEVLPLQGAEPGLVIHIGSGSDGESMVRALLEETLSLGYPAEWLLMQGGDNRLIVDPATGLNKYGCSPKPRPWAVTFASCTASSISDMAYLTAEKMREEVLLSAFRNGIGTASLDQAERTRREIMHTFGLNKIPGAEIIFSSSGTDVELIALYLTLSGHEEHVTNILVAPNEVGSGTVSAAGGLHFDSLTPLGSRVQPGSPVAGIDSKRVELIKIPIRHSTGEPVKTDALDRKIFENVECACRKGGRVLLHLLDSSKTGVGAPSVEMTRKIKTIFGQKVNVLVDAAQMRLSRQALQDYVNDGFLVIVTGSKFFTGPPLSGALVIPPAIARAVDSFDLFPDGLADYATQSDFPNRWHALTGNLANTINVGLLLRWQAALWEIKAFYSVSPARQFETVRQFLTSLIDAIQKNPNLEFLLAPALKQLHGKYEEHWDQIQTIFSFLVKRRDGSSGEYLNLTFAESQHAYRWLNMDIAHYLPTEAREQEKRVAGIRCHIGQPVRILQQKKSWYAAQRIAIGARLISGVEFDPVLGDNPKERLNTELEGALTILKKFSVICRYWDFLVTADIENRNEETIDAFNF